MTVDRATQYLAATTHTTAEVAPADLDAELGTKANDILDVSKWRKALLRFTFGAGVTAAEVSCYTSLRTTELPVLHGDSPYTPTGFTKTYEIELDIWAEKLLCVRLTGVTGGAVTKEIVLSKEAP